MRGVEYHFKVNFGDTDAAGIVYYPNFYKWMDQSTHNLFTMMGYPTSKLIREDKVGLPIVEAKCEFKSPLFFDDEVMIQSNIIDMKDKILTIVHQFSKSEQHIAQGYETRAWCDLSGDKPKAISIPVEVRSAIQQVQSLV